LSEKIEKCVDKVKKFNESETTFKLPLSPHENLQTVQKQFAPYYKLWEIAMEFELEREAWCTGSFVK
jgi:dynein heavy chain